MDESGNAISSDVGLSMGLVDLHLHSTCSDGEFAPQEVVRRAAEVSLSAMALTDHDTLAGVEEAIRHGESVGVRVIGGCEFSVGVWWGELHLLGYFLPADDPSLNKLLATQRRDRVERAQAIVSRLNELGATVSMDEVLAQADGGAVGRPHVARALVKAGSVASVNEAFGRYLADGGRAYVPKTLPALDDVTAMVSASGGVTSAAHLKDRGTRDNLLRLQNSGVDAVEVLHPAHNQETVIHLDKAAGEIGMLRSGGSDWHGDSGWNSPHRKIGAQPVPVAWLASLEALHHDREQAADKTNPR